MIIAGWCVWGGTCSVLGLSRVYCLSVCPQTIIWHCTWYPYWGNGVSQTHFFISWPLFTGSEFVWICFYNQLLLWTVFIYIIISKTTVWGNSCSDLDMFSEIEQFSTKIQSLYLFQCKCCTVWLYVIVCGCGFNEMFTIMYQVQHRETYFRVQFLCNYCKIVLYSMNSMLNTCKNAALAD